MIFDKKYIDEIRAVYEKSYQTISFYSFDSQAVTFLINDNNVISIRCDECKDITTIIGFKKSDYEKAILLYKMLENYIKSYQRKSIMDIKGKQEQDKNINKNQNQDGDERID